MRKLLVILLLTFAETCLAGSPRVLVSIKPLYALTAEIMSPVGKPELLLRGSDTPHSYALRPSDARRLENADLIIWVGPELEGFLLKPLQTLGSGSRVLTLLQQDSLLRLPQRNGGFWDPDNDHAGGTQDHDHSSQKTQSFNPHLWLDPVNAQTIVQLITKELILINPENKDNYQSRADQLIGQLATLDNRLRERLTGLRGRPYLVFHDAYQYFENRYQLSAIGSVTIAPDRLPGTRHMSEIRGKIATSGAVCLFSEPQFQPRLVKILQNETGIRTGVLDPLGANLPEGSRAYFQLMNGLADNLEGCLGKQN